MMRNGMAAGAAGAALVFGVLSEAAAQSVAVPGRTPANPQLLISIPDTSALWGGLSASGGGRAAIDYVKARDWFAGPAGERIEGLEEQLGFSLAPEELLTETLAGVDMYLVEQGPRTGFVINATFTNPEAPGAILDLLMSEAKASRGISGGVSADTVIESHDENGRVLSLPAFEIYMAVQGSTMTYTNAKSSLESTMADEGRALFDSDYFARYMSTLRNDASLAWMFGEFAHLGSLAPRVDPAMLEPYEMAVAGVKFNATADYMKLSMFRHQETMRESERRYALAAPPPGDVEVFNYFPQNTALAIGTNYFDGAELLEGVLDSLENARDQMPLDRAAIEQQLQNSRMLLGFDVRNDLLYNIGPNLGLAVGALDLQAAAASPFPAPEILFVTEVKDRDGFTAVVDKLSAMVNLMLAPATEPAERAGEGEATPTPAPTPEPAVQTASYQGEQVFYVEADQLAAAGISPAWCLTSDGRFLLSADREKLEKALATGAGGGDSLMASEAYQKVLSNLEALKNTLFVADMGAVIGMLESQQSMITRGMNPEQAAQYEEGMALLRQISSVAACAAYRNNGKRQEYLVVMEK